MALAGPGLAHFARAFGHPLAGHGLSPLAITGPGLGIYLHWEIVCAAALFR